jgi:ectoine hydrolase
VSNVFALAEYQSRLQNVRAQMERAGLDFLLLCDPANMNYLTGYEGWSFYVPQCVAVSIDGDSLPIWIGRQMDAAQAPLTSWLPSEQVIGYPEIYVQASDKHPMQWIASYLASRGWDAKRVGVEMDTYYFSPKALAALQAGLPNARWLDADLLVNWVRAVKSEAELGYMRNAARLAGHVMQTALDVIRPGVRQCDTVASIVAAQIGGDESFSGDLPALPPIVMSGRAGSAPHPTWTNEFFQKDETTALELGAACHRYNAGLARTLHLGEPPTRLLHTASVVEEGMEAALAAMKPGVAAGEVEAAWRRVLDRHGLQKDSRIGYAIGLGYPPDWGEHTVSLRAGERTLLLANMTLHLMLGMWLENWGMEMSETVRITDSGAECLTSFPRGVHRGS